ncbi:uncharacterized protein LOC128275291 [Anopheles cruzii]|uniref:uncharacterized protein LOC128275291 n=1 Tax=Anopheles cruzii TaxID=68878 RepID=UPI0022EC8D7E|nr:uncharacterized protein LOC128275291 [Anopheles cruzii]
MMKLCWALLLASVLLDQPSEGLSARTRRDLVEKATGVLLQGAAKIKEALDHGVSAKSEGKRSIDIFGFKFGSDRSVGGGFGDAANPGASENTDDLVRRRRSLDVLNAAAQPASLLPQSPFGTNVNIVKISSVKNVNNFGELPEPAEPATTAAPAAARRKRSPDLLQVANYEKKSLKLDSELSGGNMLKTHEALESVRGSSRALVREMKRNKREPQSTGTTGEAGDENSTGGPPPKGGCPPRGPPRGPPGRGPPPGGCRGGPPPEDGDDDMTTVATTAAGARRRREIPGIVPSVEERAKRSPCRGGGGRRRTTTTEAGELTRRKRDDHDSPLHYDDYGASSDYSDDTEEKETAGRSKRSAVTPGDGSGSGGLHRNRRQALGGDAGAKVGSWFEQLAGVFMETVSKVVAVTKGAFGKGGQQ